MALRPGSEAQANLVHTPRVTLQAHGLQSPEAPGARSLHGALIVFLHRQEVAVQRCGVTAGAEVHRCLGAVGRLQREREVLFP